MWKMYVVTQCGVLGINQLALPSCRIRHLIFLCSVLSLFTIFPGVSLQVSIELIIDLFYGEVQSHVSTFNKKAEASELSLILVSLTGFSNIKISAIAGFIVGSGWFPLENVWFMGEYLLWYHNIIDLYNHMFVLNSPYSSRYCVVLLATKPVKFVSLVKH